MMSIQEAIIYIAIGVGALLLLGVVATLLSMQVSRSRSKRSMPNSARDRSDFAAEIRRKYEEDNDTRKL